MAAVARAPMNDDFLDSLLSDCEPTTFESSNGFSPFEFPIASMPEDKDMFTSPSITPSIVPPSMSPTQGKVKMVAPPEMKLERAPSPDSVRTAPGSPKESLKRSFEDALSKDTIESKVLKVAKEGDVAQPPGKKAKKQEDRRERKNQREKQRRTELNSLFDNMVDLLGLPKETKADKVTVLASAINTIRQLRSTIRPELLQMVNERVVFDAPVSEVCETVQAIVKREVQAQQPMQAQPKAPHVPQPVVMAPLAVVASTPCVVPASIDDLTYFDPGSVFADM